MGLLVGSALTAVWALGWEVERRVGLVRKGLGGATPLAFGVGAENKGAVVNGWGFAGKRD